MTTYNGAMSGSIQQAAKPTHDSDGFIGEAAPLPPLQDYIGEDGMAEVISNCFKHYQRIPQEEIGNPDYDLTCLKCTKGNGIL
jgi:hypothetical protein